MPVKKCAPDCTCLKHSGSAGRKKDKVPSSPCLYCGTVRKVYPCNGPGMAQEKKFCDRTCFTSHQQRRMATRRATGDSRKYDMKDAEYQARYEAQGGLCAICKLPKLDVNGKLHRDHCHSTGVWRGLLCQNCNKGLGHFYDDPALLMMAAEYLVTGGVPLVEVS